MNFFSGFISNLFLMQGNHYRPHYVGLSLHWMALSWIISRMTRGLQQEACAMVGAKQFGGCWVMFVDHAMWICAAAQPRQVYATFGLSEQMFFSTRFIHKVLVIVAVNTFLSVMVMNFCWTHRVLDRILVKRLPENTCLMQVNYSRPHYVPDVPCVQSCT